MSVGHRLKTVREQRGMSREALSVASRVSASAIKQYENGKRTPMMDKLVFLAHALQVDVRDLLYDGGVAPPIERTPIVYYSTAELAAEILRRTQEG